MALVLYVYIIFGYAIYGIISFFQKKSDEANRIELRNKMHEDYLQKQRFEDEVGDPNCELEKKIKKELLDNPDKFEKLKEEATTIIRENATYADGILKYLEGYGKDAWLDLVAQFEGIKQGRILGLNLIYSTTALSRLEYIPPLNCKIVFWDDGSPIGEIGLLKWAENVLQSNGVDTYHVYDGALTDSQCRIKLHQFAYYKDRRI